MYQFKVYVRYLNNFNRYDWRLLKAENVSIKSTLNETLDTGSFTVRDSIDLGLHLQDYIRIYRIVNNRGYEVATMEIAHINKSLVRVANNVNYYDYTIQLVELTKDLERVVCDNMTHTLRRDKSYNLSSTGSDGYKESSDYLQYLYNTNNNLVGTINSESVSAYTKSCYETGKTITLSVEFLQLSDYATLIADSNYEKNLSVTVIAPNGARATYTSFSSTISICQTGIYNIYVNLYYTYTPSQAHGHLLRNFYISSIELSQLSATNKSISEVITEVLNKAETRLNSNKSSSKCTYQLADSINTKYASVVAPEFTWTRNNLFEVLSEIGSGCGMHAIPRLKMNDANEPIIVDFDELDSASEYSNETAEEINDEIDEDIEDYCTDIDSYVERITCSKDEKLGACYDPSWISYKTLRSSSTKINADTMEITTDDPIYKITKLEVKYGSTKGDLTPYVYEQAEYDALGEYGGELSKQYALCYKQGDNKITGLNYVANNIWSGVLNISFFNQYALTKILNKVGITASTWDVFKTCLFRVQYIPLVSMRLTQKKALTTSNVKNSIICNQGASEVESEYLGLALKSKIDQYGNPKRKVTLKIEEGALPQCGQLYDSMRISEIDYELRDSYAIATMTLTENYNRITRVGIDSSYRQYDISEKQIADRAMNYSMICNMGYTGPRSSSTQMGLSTFINDTLRGNPDTKPINFVMISIHNDTSRTINRWLMRSVKSYSIGRSIAFNFKMEDNYAVGSRSVEVFNSNEYAMRSVQYKNCFGEFHDMGLYFMTGLEQDSDGYFYKGVYNYSAIALANAYPQAVNPEEMLEVDAFTNSTIRLARTSVFADSRESINFTCQVHFQTDTNDIVIGEALARRNSLVTYDYRLTGMKLVVSDEYIDKQTARVKGNLTTVCTYSYSNYMTTAVTQYIDLTTNRQVTINCGTVAESTRKSWAIVDSDNNLYLGANSFDHNTIYFGY